MQQLKIGSTEMLLDQESKLISIIIPTYEAKGKGTFLLKRCLDSIASQSYKNYEIIIPDHSIDSEIGKLASTYSHMNIIHFYNERGRGNSSVNMNEGIKRANGHIIKVLHFDDQFASSNALQLLSNLYQDTSTKWGAFGFNHLVHGELGREIIPSFAHTMGCPSTSFFINDKQDPIYFDEELIIINDHDMHHRLRQKYGEPSIIPTINITIGIHEDQVTNFTTSQAREALEWQYFNNKNIK
jgi:glycosyltransferase involved in cell wall biosynthesis